VLENEKQVAAYRRPDDEMFRQPGDVVEIVTVLPNVCAAVKLFAVYVLGIVVEAAIKLFTNVSE
jgi:hypothetical protein